MTGFPQVRMRRLRQHAGIRKLVQETRFSVENLIYPLFVRHGRDVRSEIAPMPDIFQLSLDQLINEVGEASELGVEAVLLFGIPETKDPEGTEAYEPGGIIQEAVRAIKQALSEMTSAYASSRTTDTAGSSREIVSTTTPPSSCSPGWPCAKPRPAPTSSRRRR